MTSTQPTRRTVIAITSSAAAAAALAACAPPSTSSGSASSSGASSAGTGSASGGSAGASAGSAPGVELAATGDVPVGSSKLVGSGNAQVLLSHPSAGTFRAFSPSCTHQGCTVEVQSDKFVCPCHDSQFALADGAVLKGPATRPLIERDVTVQDGSVYLG